MAEKTTNKKYPLEKIRNIRACSPAPITYSGTGCAFSYISYGGFKDA